MHKIIDSCSFLPTPEALRQWFAIISKSEAYLRVFWKGFAHWADLTKEEYFAIIDGRSHEDARSHLIDRVGSAKSMSAAQFVAQMDEGGIQTAVIHNSDCERLLGVKPLPYEYTADIARQFRGRFAMLAGIDPLKGHRSVEELNHCIQQLGYTGLLVVPFRNGIPASDEAFKPLYRRCQELGAPVWIHSTNNWDPRFPMDYSHPRVVDKLAIEFPELKIMIGHAGWPWVLEAVTVAWRHPNVYVEVSAFHPKSIAEQGFGFEALLRFGPGPLRDKVLFGSTWNLLNQPMGKILNEVRKLPGVSQDLADKWLHHNAAKVLNLT